MKTQKITINRTPEQPNGMEIDVLIPETPMDQNLVSFLLPSFLRELKRNGSIAYDLPEQFRVEYKTEGTFVVSGFTDNSSFYEPPRPIAIVGLRVVGDHFDLIHAAPVLRQRTVQPPASTQGTADSAAQAAETAAQPAEPAQESPAAASQPTETTAPLPEGGSESQQPA